jgi:hypothetical protein
LELEAEAVGAAMPPSAEVVEAERALKRWPAWFLES